MSWSAINRRFPHVTFDSYQKSWRVKKFLGNKPENDKLKQMVCDSISRIQAAQMGISTEINHGEKETALSGLAEELGIGVLKSAKEKMQGLVTPEAINLVEPTEAHVEIFPRGLWCPKCKFYGIFRDFSAISSLSCPYCKDGVLEQRSNFFLCPRCGKQEELIPPHAKTC